MTTTAANFSETTLLDRYYRARVLNADGRLLADNVPFMETLRAVTENTTMRFGELTRGDKTITIDAIYPHACGITATEYTSNDYCSFSGPQGSSNKKTYTMPTPLFAEFSLYHNIGRTNELDNADFYAENRAAVELQLLQTVSERIVTAIEANIGTNLFTTGKGTVNGTDTEILSAYFNPSLFPYLKEVAIHNKFMRPYILDSNLLFQAIMAAAMNAGNANGSGDAAMSRMFPYYADVRNIDAVNTTERVMYMIEPGAINFVTKNLNYLGTQPVQMSQPFYMGDDEWRWSEQSLLFPSISYDVHYTRGCDSATDELIEKYKYILRYGAFGIPTGCDTDNTGILRFLCV